MHTVDGQVAFTTVPNLADSRMALALAFKARLKLLGTASPHRPARISVASKPFPAKFGKDWDILVVTPTDDFVGDLRATDRMVTSVIADLLVIRFGLILFSWRGCQKTLKGCRPTSTRFTS